MGRDMDGSGSRLVKIQSWQWFSNCVSRNPDEMLGILFYFLCNYIYKFSIKILNYDCNIYKQVDSILKEIFCKETGA
jgi:hypothetical protein